jgi:hypothetical protein
MTDQADLSQIEDQRSQLNTSRFDPTADTGFYESYFQRANHPSEAKAFWIRYTVFSPKRRPSEAVGQLWGIYFDGNTREIIAVKEAFPIQDCEFARSEFSVRIGEAWLNGQALRGQIEQNRKRLSWDLRYEGSESPLLLLQPDYYQRKFPAAKALVGTPLAKYEGVLRLNEREISVDSWIGSQNHNWGTKHTDQYAWGQVAGFDNDPLAFLECSTARLKLGPFWTPPLTNVVVRIQGQPIVLNSLRQIIRAKGKYGYFTWSIKSRSADARVQISIDAAKELFVGLHYENPPGGVKTCLNTKLARCTLRVERVGSESIDLTTASRAAFEILTNDQHHGVSIAA